MLYATIAMEPNSLIALLRDINEAVSMPLNDLGKTICKKTLPAPAPKPLALYSGALSIESKYDNKDLIYNGADTIIRAITKPDKLLKKFTPNDKRNLPVGVKGLSSTSNAIPIMGWGTIAGKSTRVSAT